MNTWMILGLFFLFALAALDIALVVSVGRQGDERRRMIVQRASSNTLAALVAYLLYCMVENFVRGAVHHQSAEPINPFVLLTIIAMLYFANLLYYKRKYGG